MSEMVDRIALALAYRDSLDPAAPDNTKERWVQARRKDARTIIEAMREPTEAMWIAGANQRGTLATWQAMIAAAVSAGSAVPDPGEVAPHTPSLPLAS